MNRRVMWVLVLLALALVGAVWLRLLAGRDDSGPVLTMEYLDLRIGRAITGVIVGAALSMSGVFLQALLRNPLASPDILGLASGSGLGVMLVAYAAYRTAGILGAEDHPGLGTGAAAVAGALAALAAVWLLSQRRGVLDPVTLVLVGVAISVSCSAGSSMVRHLLPDQGVAAGRLLLGTLRDCGTWELVITGAVTLAGGVIGLASARAMDAASLGDDEARSVGLSLGRLRSVLFIASGVLTAASVVLAGPVGFVGLVCPHLVRMACGPRHGPLLIGSIFAGGALVVLCDALVRLIDLGGGQMPIGVLTSLVGGPVLILMLRQNLGRR